MSDRYTSPELSRQLAEAGIEQTDGAPAYINAHQARPTVSVTGCECADCSGVIRALDLTDVLEELMRDREGGPLLKYYELCGRKDVRRHFFEADSYPPSCIEATTPVEAAGLVLLALLRERAKP